jgi:hypothetical protein
VVRGRGEDGDLPHSAPIGAPRAPIGAPRWTLTRKQWVGLPVLLLIPVLALFGVFGERTDTITTATRSLGVTVSYPARLRYRQTERLEIAVTNRTESAIDSVRVSLDTAYLARFIEVRVRPEPFASYDVRLADIAPGETRLVVVDMTGNRYWRHPASIGVAMGEELATVHFSSQVFP